MKPMLATKIDRPPIGTRWTYEIKLDGVRTLAIVEDGRLRLSSRNGTEMSRWFPELAEIAQQIDAREAVLDGEVILRDGSVTSFNELLVRVRSRSRRSDDEPVTYVVFDVLTIDGVSLVDLPLSERRERLRAIVRESPRLVISRVYDDGPALYAAAIAHDLEGIVGKIITSPYTEGRSRDWVKIKAPDAAARHEWTGVTPKRR